MQNPRPMPPVALHQYLHEKDEERPNEINEQPYISLLFCVQHYLLLLCQWWWSN